MGAPFIILRNTAYRAEIFSIILYGIYSNAHTRIEHAARDILLAAMPAKDSAEHPHLRLPENTAHSVGSLPEAESSFHHINEGW